MFELNNPAVISAVRQSLETLVSEGALDEPSAALILRAADKAGKRAPAGWLFALAHAAGASPERAMQAAAVAHVLYAAFDVTDDVQDGDAAAYLGDLSLGLQVNVAMHLWIVGGLLVQRLAAPGSQLPATVFTDICRAVCGQRADLTRAEWHTARYEAMIRRIGGAQFAVYTALVAEAAGLPLDLLRDFAVALASLVQLESDLVSADARITALPGSEVDELRARLRQELGAALAAAPAATRRTLEQVACFADPSLARDHE